jgi:pSer/pThr/pTyr-binding forkhead associated (FHA) protein
MSDRMSGARLVVRAGDGEGASYPLAAAETLIGRSSRTDITLEDEGISREHALILYEEESGSFTVEDLQSTNGTQVNGKRVRSVTLQHGDELLIGRTCFVFHCEPDAD